MKKRGWSKSGLVFVLSISLLLFASFIARAEEAKYIYDDLGRLYQVIDEQGNVATYNYDAVGNLLSITKGIGAPPEVTGIFPDSVGVGITVDFTISGNRLSGAAIRTDNAGITISNTITADTSIRTRFKISPLARLGSTTVTVSNALGLAQVSFDISTLITLYALSPDSGPISRLVEIYGVGFSVVPSENQVRFNGVVAPVYYSTPTRILTSVPVGATSGPVTVTTPGRTSNGIHFTVTSASGPRPTIQSITPNVGSVEGGNVVTITGSGFTSDTAVYIGDNPVAALNILNTTTLEITTAPGQAGSADVLVRNANGDAFRPGGFRYLPGPLQKVVSFSPTAGLTNIPINSPVVILFAEPVDRASINTSSFSLRGVYSGLVTGTFSYDTGDRLVIFRPNSNLLSYSNYTFNLTRDIKSVNGVPLDRPFSASFTTSGLIDTDSPTVTVSPWDGATDVPVNAPVVFGFSEPINLTTINPSNITITNNGMPVTGNITPSNQNKVVTFTPFSAFIPNSLVRVTLSRRATDIVGNPIVGCGGVGTDFVSTFRTSGTSDSIAPQVINISPADGATRVNPNTAISVTFNEAINSVTVTPDTFTVYEGGARKTGRISFSGQNATATFTPDQPFAEESSVTVELKTGITDMAGNAMSAPFTSSFTVQRGPILSIAYSGDQTRTVGDTIDVQVTNTGDVDTTSTYKVQLLKTTIIYQNTITDVIQAGESKHYGFQIPLQAVAGDYSLNAEVIDSRGQKTASFYPLNIIGLSAAVSTRTDKDIYLENEAVTGLTTISNGPFDINGGTLKLSVSRGRVEFNHFLPKTGWTVLSNPRGVAVGPDGTVYVVDTENHRILKFDGNGSFITRWGSYCNTDTNWDDIPDQSCDNGQFNYPDAIAVGPDGLVYVADGNHRIQKFDGNGNFITRWGNRGSGDGQFNFPGGIAVWPDGSVYVADTHNHRIQKFDGNGNFVMKWGTFGNGDSQFFYPAGIAVGLDGSVYVADTNNHRIQKFDGNGNFITKWGSNGTGNGQFNKPTGISTGPDGSVYVTDTWNNRVQKFTSSGNFIRKWGSSGSGNGQFSYPFGIAVASDSSVYVADYHDRIQKFDSNGNFIMRWGDGSGRGEFNTPTTIAIGSDGSVYVGEEGNDRIQRFDNNGNFISRWGIYGSGEGQYYSISGIALGVDGSLYVADFGYDRIWKFDSSGNFVKTWGSFGTADGRFRGATGIAIVGSSVYVADRWNHRIQKFDSNGNFIGKWGRYGSGDGEFNTLFGIAAGPDGSLYVTDYWNHRIQKFDSNGNFIAKWGSRGSGDGQFEGPTKIAVGPDGSVYVTDMMHNRIQKFDSNGNFLKKWGRDGMGDGEFKSPIGVAVGSDGSVYVADSRNHRIQKMSPVKLFETTLLMNQSANMAQDYSTDIGTLSATGELHLQAMLINSLGQTIAQSSYPFYRGSPQRILGILPAEGQTYVPINTSVMVTFAWPVDRATVNSSTFFMVEEDSGLAVSGVFSFDSNDTVVIFRPAANLSPYTSYTVHITRSIKNTDGISLDQPFSSVFTTGAADMEPPTVYVSPQNGAMDVPLNAQIVFVFSEPINLATIGSSTIMVINNGTPVSGSIALGHDNTVVTFTPSSHFLTNSVVSVTLSHTVTDVAGNPIIGSSGVGTDFVSSFTTGSTVDNIPPQVLSITPPDGATEVDYFTRVSVTFNEPINPMTVNEWTFTLSVDGVIIPGQLSFSGQNTVVTFTPDQSLPDFSVVTVTLADDISDIAGNAMPFPFISTFTTGVIPM